MDPHWIVGIVPHIARADILNSLCAKCVSRQYLFVGPGMNPEGSSFAGGSKVGDRAFGTLGMKGVDLKCIKSNVIFDPWRMVAVGHHGHPQRSQVQTNGGSVFSGWLPDLLGCLEAAKISLCSFCSSV